MQVGGKFDTGEVGKRRRTKSADKLRGLLNHHLRDHLPRMLCNHLINTRTKEHVKNLRSRVPGEEHYYLPLHSNSVLRRQGPCCCERIWALGMHRGVIYQLLDHLSMELSHEKLLDWTSGDDGGRKYWQRTNGSDFFHVDEAFDWKQYYVEPHGLCWWCKHTDEWFSEAGLVLRRQGQYCFNTKPKPHTRPRPRTKPGTASTAITTVEVPRRAIGTAEAGAMRFWIVHFFVRPLPDN